ncbi:type II CRISPR RNA-guided endonuclease Cas9 [Staphylococcus canis]|uniref:CRISPR-associated endonuclease Cas9 n=1 Tax=Staphylococcus canis TaxID=2724942 RepID=A0ABS0T7F7_9STAP|nr:type II CRISPR RNA-guided endonuclease Cas9 [Staphylococcus canis]MBI5974693.1 type II CRISPR RNA-guided endonuclease Cas9 [Staphylococcus canis]
MVQKPYILSLDIGTGSVGYACMDLNFNVLNYFNKDALGVYLFDGAETAETRRLARGARRRNNRRIKRLGLLQEVLAPLVRNPNFYQFERQHQWKNDNTDFKHKSLSEVLTYLGYNSKAYPTIYHLQAALLNEKRQFDPELIYLALYHLVKYRGHFLFERLDMNDISGGESFDDFIELVHLYEVENQRTLDLDRETIEEIYNILLRNDLTKSDRVNQVKKKAKILDQFAKMVLGLKFSEYKLFDNADNMEALKEINQSHTLDSEYEENLSEALTQSQIELIQLANKIYSTIVLKEILKGHDSIAIAKVAAYEKFKHELKTVKDLVYQADATKAAFKSIFVSSKSALKAYEAYPDNKNFKALCTFDQYRIKPKDKYKSLLTELKKYIPEDHELYNELNQETLLKVLNTTDNASIPMQNNLYEAEKILRNQQVFHSDITDEMIDKVLELIRFRIPYYVGPLVKNKDQAKFGWMVKNENESVKPWNFETVVNRSESATEFIRRMTSKCTYLINEDVLPKHSLLYQEMEVLNELNNVQIRTQSEPKNRKYRMTPKVKQFAFDHIFTQTKTVSHRHFIDKMLNSNYREYFMKNGDVLSVYGTQDEKKFTSKLSSYIDMKKIFGSVEDKRAEIEQIILWITLFEDKNILVKKLKENYPDLTEKQINQLKKLNYSGWGRLSEKLLTHEHQGHSVIELLRQTDKNFMEIITDDTYDFESFIQAENQIPTQQIRYQDIADLATSPALKKGIWSTIKLVRELTSIFGEPEKIIIEFATEDGEKGKRQKTRKQSWEQNIKDKKLKSIEEYQHIIQVANGLTNEQLREDSLWLYLSQNGKCMYSGKKIDLDLLLSKSGDKYYEIDHIIPRSYIKDDSIDNKVLVLKEMNQTKGDLVPLQFISNPDYLIQFWKRLNASGLISQLKLNRLMKKEFTEMDKEGFIQRQLVETRQISVHVRDFLNEEYPNTKVIPMKAKIVSEFRKKYDIPKIRSLNDEHHAIDAYLNGVVYRGAQVAYKDVDFFDFNFRWEKVKEKWKQMGEFNRKNKLKNLFFINALRKIDLSKGEPLISKVEMDLDRFKVNISKKRANISQHFYKQTAYSPKTNTPKYESNKTDVAVYTEMNRYRTHLLAVRTIDKKGKSKVNYYAIDEYMFEHYKHQNHDMKALALHLAHREISEEILDAQIVYTLYKGDLLMLNGHPCYLVSSGEVINAKQFKLSLDEQRALKKALNKKDTPTEVLIEQYANLAEKAIEAYAEYLNTKSNQDKAQKVRDLFINTTQTHQDFVDCVEELFKATKASAVRSEKIGSRKIVGKKAFTEKKSNMKVAYTSITGLKTTRPKSLFKLAESNNEL